MLFKQIQILNSEYNYKKYLIYSIKNTLITMGSLLHQMLFIIQLHVIVAQISIEV